MRTICCELELIERKIQLFFKQNEACQHLAEILGIGVLSATELVATVGDANQFQSGRHLVAYLGLVPRQWSSGGKTNLCGISKRGDAYLRKLLIHEARSLCVTKVLQSGSMSVQIEAAVDRPTQAASDSSIGYTFCPTPRSSETSHVLQALFQPAISIPHPPSIDNFLDSIGDRLLSNHLVTLGQPCYHSIQLASLWG